MDASNLSDDEGVAVWACRALAALGPRRLPGAIGLVQDEAAARKARYEELGLTYFEAPPLPEGATEADLERLEDEDLEAMYPR